MTNFDRNIDKACSWIFPLLADSNGNLKMQIFVLRKDTADILGKNCNNVRVNIQTSVHFMCSILGSMESQISKPSIPYSCPHWETQRWQYKGREGQGDACIESRVRATQTAFYEFSRRYFQLYTFRNCKLLISTKCAGMGCDLPDIRITVCIGEAAIGDVHLYTLC